MCSYGVRRLPWKDPARFNFDLFFYFLVIITGVVPKVC